MPESTSWNHTRGSPRRPKPKLRIGSSEFSVKSLSEGPATNPRFARWVEKWLRPRTPFRSQVKYQT
jgi:hypothetical protein